MKIIDLFEATSFHLGNTFLLVGNNNKIVKINHASMHKVYHEVKILEDTILTQTQFALLFQIEKRIKLDIESLYETPKNE